MKPVLSEDHKLFSQISHRLSEAKNHTPAKFAGVTWFAKENVATGAIGPLFYQLELFKLTRDEKILAIVQNDIKLISESADSFNYSLFFGKSGIPWFYLELFRATNDRKFLTRSIEIAKQHISSNPFELTMFNDVSLYKGASGVILLYIMIYRESGDAELLQIIDKLTRRLILECTMKPEGIFWHKFSNLPPYGLAFGNSGIGYLFHCLYLATSQKMFHEFDKLITGFEENTSQLDERSHRLETVRNSIVFGPLGSKMIKWIKAPRIDQYSIKASDFPVEHSNLGINGMAGRGLALLELYNRTGELKYYHDAVSLATEIKGNKLLEMSDLSFMEGLSGIGYFLLKVSSVENCKNAFDLILPPADVGTPIELNVSSDQFRNILIEKFFPKTLKLPQAKEILLRVSGYPLPIVVEEFNLLFKQVVDENMMDDKSKTIFKRESFLYDKLKTFQHRSESLESDRILINEAEKTLFLEQSDLYEVTLQVSRDCLVWTDDVELNYDSVLEVPAFVEILTAYGKNAMLFKVSNYGIIEEFNPGLYLLITKNFSAPTRVADVCNKIENFIGRQSDQSLALLQNFWELSSPSEIRGKLNELLIEKIRFYLTEGILSVTAPSDEFNVALQQPNNLKSAVK